MDRNQEGNPDVMAEFRKRRTRQLIAIAPFLVAISPLLFLENAGPDGLFGIPAVVIAPVCLAVIVAMFIFSFLNWRCPACKGYLGKAMSPKFCQKCGARLQG